MADVDHGTPPSAPAPIGVLSDDLTGANAVAARFAAHGVPAFTALGPVPLLTPREVAVLVVDTATRDAAPDAAAEAVRTAVGTLRRWGARLLTKRIDTTLRGSIAAETAALLDILGPDTLALVVPAAPEAGRTCVGGRVLVAGRPLSDVAGLPDEPLRLFAAQPPAVGCPLAVVRQGPDAVRAAMERAAAGGARAVVCDAQSEADIATLATAAATVGRAVLPVDPGGFTLALAQALGLVTAAMSHPASEGVHAEVLRPRGPILTVLGSPAAVTTRQIEAAVAQGWLRRVPVDGATLADDVARRRAAARVLGVLAAARAPAVGIDPAPRDGEDAPARAPAVADALARLVGEVLAHEPAVAGLFLTGGAVARAVLERLGTQGVWVERELLPLAALGRVANGPHAGLAVVTKGGMVGGTDALIRCLAALEAAAARQFG